MTVEATVEAEIRAFSAAWDAALISNDASRVAGFMADDWHYVGPAGPTAKADILAWIESGRLVHHDMTVVGTPRIVHAGDTVLLTARKTSSGLWDGTPYVADEWITEVCFRVDSSWQCVLSQKTAVDDGGEPRSV